MALLGPCDMCDQSPCVCPPRDVPPLKAQTPEEKRVSEINYARALAAEGKFRQNMNGFLQKIAEKVFQDMKSRNKDKNAT